jgi:hypothetical protein
MYYAWKVDAEVGGMGILEFNSPDPNDIYVKEVFLVEQTVHGTECNLSSEGMFNKYAGFIQGGDDYRATHMQLWWHSHYTMAPGHSSTDFATMKDWDAEYLVSLIINRKGELKAKLMTKVPVMVIGDIDVSINWFDIPENVVCEEDVKELVKKQSYAVATYVGGQKQPQAQYTPYGGHGGYVHNPQTGKWDTVDADDDDWEYTPTHRMTEAEWEASEAEYFKDVQTERVVGKGAGKKKKKGNGAAKEQIGFPVGEMDAAEKASLRMMWDEKGDCTYD